MNDVVYQDSDLVYVDPDAGVVVGVVEWLKNERPKSKPYVALAKEEKKEGSRRSWRKFYPYGTYRSMKRAYRLERRGPKEQQSLRTLEEILPKALSNAFWND